MSKYLAITAMLLVLGLVNFSIYKKEQHLKYGTEVLLELAPVDPRSLMQGDYMTLRLVMNDSIKNALRAAKHTQSDHDGYISVALDDNKVARFLSLSNAAKGAPLSLKYRFRDQRVKFGTNAFFFEEGSAQAYEQARYGVFKVAAGGEMILVDMADKSFARISESLSLEGQDFQK